MTSKSTTINIFLLRGLAREVRHWGTFPETLRAAGAGIEVTPLEIPGAGVLRNESSPTTISEYVERIRPQFLRHSRDQEHNFLLGLSLGGMIAAQWIDTYPSDYRAAVIINSSSSLSPPRQRISLSGLKALIGSLLIRDVYRQEKRIADKVCNLADTEKIARQWADISRSAPIARYNVLRQLFASAIFSLPREVKVPVLILSSARDRLVSPSCSRDIAQVWGSPVISHNRAGHDLTTDDPDWCISHILPWLFRLGR
ncbi:alpha/beta fold hydrolase [Desulfopila inferna]|uniref:alpha/beta fold hydrolase n=1 Tax=Desulfopila inferna TaxID=468528 RepID=UPI001966580D|nr:alpha/beta hydrolase [Desulfopila inferna]MBM9603920.1 alpha/beta fold hydrolase [Desulfopila inferna]